MKKNTLAFAVVSLLFVGCGGSELPETESAAPQEAGTVQAQACVVVTSTYTSCNTRDFWKMKATDYCPSGHIAVAVDTFDPCASPAGTYHSANITCCQY